MPVPVSPTKMSASDPKRIGGVWSFISRFNALVDWIISLSPSGATQYDTGWIALTAESGYTAGSSLAVRRTGNWVYYRGSVVRDAGGFTTSTYETMFTIPVEFRPTQRQRVTPPGYASGSALAVPIVQVETSGAVQGSRGGGPTGATWDTFYFTGISHPVD